MGSSPICSRVLCCVTSNLYVPPKSDLFVPQISLKITKQKTQKKVKSLKTYTINKRSPLLGRMTTERFIFNNSCLKNSFTMKSQLKIKDKIKLSKHTLNRNQTHSFANRSKDDMNINNFDKFKTMKVNLDKGHFIPRKESNSGEKSVNLKYEVSEHLLDSMEEMNIINILLYHYLFHTTSKENLQYIINEIKEFQIETGSAIFYEGDEGSCMFIIKSGRVTLTSGDTKKKIIVEDGSIFGELALVQDDINRTYNAMAETDLKFYSLDKNGFFAIQDNFINKNPFEFNLFKYISEEEKVNLELLATSLEFTQNQVITDLNGIFWVRSGTICLFDLSDNEKDTYGPNEFIGIAKLSENNKEEEQVKSGNSFKLVELTKDKIDSKIMAKEDVLCTVIPDFAFIEVFGLDYQNKLYKSFFRETICKNKTFESIFAYNKISDIIKVFNLKEYKKKEFITNNDNLPKKIVIIVEGHASAEEGNGNAKIMISAEQIIGEELFYNLEQKNYMVESNHLITLECNWDTFIETATMFGKPLSQIIDELTAIYFFNGLNILKLIEISNNLKIITLEKDKKIIQKGDKVEDIYFIIEGSVKFIEDDHTFKEYHKGSSFGEIFLFNGKPAQGEIVVYSQKCVLYKMQKQYYFELLTDIELNKKTKKKLCLEDMEIFPSSIFYLTTLHKGSASNIYLIHNKIWVYVMKAIYIQNYYQASTFEGKIIPNVLNEKSASKVLDNPFLLKYVKTLKNNSWCFFVEEYINGITLSELFRMCQPFGSISFCRFHSACFILMLEALKEVGIIHRDIKPENIIIEKNGYPKLIDFSCCKRINDVKTKTLIGTPFFIAPEVLKGNGYTYSCDYWSTGILIYYLYYGEYPFGNNTTQPDTIYKEIINKKLVFVDNNYKKHNHKFSTINDLKDVINCLLNKNEEERMKKISKIKEMDFYKGIDFNKLKKMELKSPYIPQVVKVDYNKELNNVGKPFMNFIPEPTQANKNSVNEVVFKNNDKDDSYFNYHKNQMKWFDKF